SLSLIMLIFKWQTSGLTFNPIQFVEQYLGRAAINMLVVSLAVTPLVTLTGWRRLSKHSRALGLYTFFYFSLHFLTFAVLDYGLNLREIFKLMIEKPFIIIGSAAGLILLALATTSFKYWMKHLGKKWKKLHRLVYLVGALAVLHNALALKGSLTTLSGNIVRPLVLGFVITLLLVLRIPPVKRWIVSLRQRQWIRTQKMVN
ncbi:MAG: ferric reductase-like transmembrane domain-containing protein, partial [Chloroflexota bacterium]